MATFYARYPATSGGSGSLTFADSIVNNAGTVTLVNDSAAPGNSKYYGTDSGGTLGYFSLPTVTAGDLTDVGTDGITITGGTGAVLGSGTSISQHVADATHNGYLSSADWNTFSGKQDTITIGALDAQAANADGLALVASVLSAQSADGTHPGLVNITTQTFAGDKTFNGTISVPGSGANSQRFGASAVATGARCTSAGDSANANDGPDNTAVGYMAQAGQAGDATKAGNLAVGSQTVANSTGGFFNINIGYNSIVGGQDNIRVGCQGGTISGIQCIALGHTASTNGFSDIYILAHYGAATASNQLIVGSTTSKVYAGYFGAGPVSTAPHDFSFNATGGSGSDIAAGDFYFNGGISTGNATPGRLLFQTTDAGASGATAQTLATRLVISDALQLPQISTPSNAAASTDKLYFKSDDKLYGLDSLGNEVLIGPGGGTGTVTSVGLSVPASSIFGATGSPVTTSGTLGLTVAGTSGGIPYFDTTSTLSSSAALSANELVLGGGAGASPVSLGSTGTSGQVLTSNGAAMDPSWQDIPASALAISTQTTTYTLQNTDDVILANGTFTITLQSVSGATIKPYRIKNIGSGTITIARAGADTIDGGTSYTISLQYASIELIPDGSGAWYIF